MKLEYLPYGAKKVRLIRLYDYLETEVHTLRTIAGELATGVSEKIALEGEGWVAAIGGCKLTLQLSERDFGIHQLGPHDFSCVLDASGWNNVAWLLEPFCNPDTTEFQWLVNRGEIALLISRNGQWRKSKIVPESFLYPARPSDQWFRIVFRAMVATALPPSCPLGSL